jgi:hypothetical protein
MIALLTKLKYPDSAAHSLSIAMMFPPAMPIHLDRLIWFSRHTGNRGSAMEIWHPFGNAVPQTEATPGSRP